MPDLIQQMNNLNIFATQTLSPDPMSVSSTDDEDFGNSPPPELQPLHPKQFEEQRRIHEELLSLSSSSSSSATNTPRIEPPQIAIEYASLEQQIRKQREITKQLRERQGKLEEQFFQELENLPNGSVETNDLRFSIRTRKKRSRMNSDHIVTCNASYAAHYGLIPSDEPRHSEFVELHQEIAWVMNERKKDPENEELRAHQFALAKKKKEMYMFLAMDMQRYVERSRSETTVPFLSRRSNKRRKLSGGIE